MQTSIFDSRTQHLYLHIPFCNHICTYCDFKRILKTNKTQYLVDNYLENTLLAIQKYCVPKQFKTIFLGGGTPNCLTNNELEKLLAVLEKYAADNCEFSIECNPDLITIDQILIFKKYRVNRISLGVQSTNNAILKQVNRLHTIEDVEHAIQLLQMNGITNISCDFIYNLENLTFQDIDDVFLFLSKNSIQHVSFYALEIKSNSLLKRLGCTIDEDKEADQLTYIIQQFAKYNYTRYEVSNWVLNPQYKCQHNLAYWLTKDWMAFGFGAHGLENKTQYQYNAPLDQPELITNPLSDYDYYQQILMMGLRLADGLDLKNPLYLQAYNFFKDKLEYVYIENNFLKAESLDLLNQTLLSLFD
ncbi:radical SAM family heme chaperone HemW [Ureaplasma sp. ES3154-GEN]|uniref:radical SAM family heme chaperone HemW n=1 Tax=Ureaplasma sp. ES3154-GEN TaxID=2984844 RepID=UPI0021E97261|nr:radical SAM family heme chaperone HemW [Ureaplasma sp. ES3154-GEN]MCV3743671.1 radical SAM family heme chaperone HemW [Ureaplasma sp. ES3154-GEN]